MIWVAHGVYLTQIAVEHAEKWGLDRGATIGAFNATFWSTFQARNPTS